jgi:hypothetical protein
VNWFDFVFFSVFLTDVMGGKITVNLKKNCTKVEKEETHAHWKRAGSALSREMRFELRQ